MGSSLPEPAALRPQQPPSVAAKPMTKRRKKKILIVMAVIAVALVVVFWGWSSTGGSYISVSEVVEKSTSSIPAEYSGIIEIRGVVSSWSGPSDVAFVLADEHNSADTISVTMTGTYPAGFENGKPVVAKGSLDSNLPLHLTASSITVGCSSKY